MPRMGVRCDVLNRVVKDCVINNGTCEQSSNKEVTE